ncbi:MAG TPA: NAD-dependent DNA ligase LigA, partial [Candidatus Cryptobacteroides sp.]|nr:NAD-dependent DNA ligase LigA [Candidatus Cryptobacteroides sp.]
RIDELREVLRENSRRYYVLNAPTMSDFEFDMLMHELEDLEAQWPEFKTSDSPTQRVGSDLKTGFVQRPHRYPMLSLTNTYSIEEVEEFSARAGKTLESDFSYCCELKFDGTAISLSYHNGRLYRALTRGDGIKGDDITENAKSISNIPKQLHGDYPQEFEIRGEVLMPYEAFDSLNAEREANEEAPFANPRNAASGSLKLLNPEEVERRGLICTLYSIPPQSGLDFVSHDQAMQAADSWGLPVSKERRLAKDISEIKNYIDYWDKERKFLPFATDGIVIKINELSDQEILGYTAKAPRWAVAYKFKAEQALTPILSIDYQVGRTGAVTPVANLEPVQLSGTIVKRATLVNADQMEALDIHEGDWVYVEKGGEIIPKITGVEPSKRASGAKKPEFPKHCPDCGTPLFREENEAKWFCPNIDGCPMQIKGKILHFVSRKAMDILAGEATVEQLYNLGYVRTPADLYDLTLPQLLTLDGWKEKSAANFKASLDASKNVPFERVLFALGIRFVGENTAKELARHFGSIDALASADKERLLEVPDVGDVIAGSLEDWFKDSRHISEIDRLRAHGLNFALGEETETLSAALEGKTIVISGVFSISRDDIKALIERHGGKNSSSISGKTSFLLAGDNPGPEKIKKCESLGVPILSEESFMELLPKEEKAKEDKVTEEKPKKDDIKESKATEKTTEEPTLF